jgi:hypothetical protein
MKLLKKFYQKYHQQAVDIIAKHVTQDDKKNIGFINHLSNILVNDEFVLPMFGVVPKNSEKLEITTGISTLIASMPTKIFAAAGLVALLTGCATVGPDFKVPAAPAVAGFAMAADAAPKIDTTAHSSGAWWTAFGSSQLDAVMAQALKGNKTLQRRWYEFEGKQDCRRARKFR